LQAKSELTVNAMRSSKLKNKNQELKCHIYSGLANARGYYYRSKMKKERERTARGNKKGQYGEHRDEKPSFQGVESTTSICLFVS
jgi:hypothetical protein